MCDYVLENGLHTPFAQWLLASAGHQDLLEIRKRATSKLACRVPKENPTAESEIEMQIEEFFKVIDEAIFKTDPKKVRFSTLGPKASAVKEVLAFPSMDIPTVINEMICSYVAEDMEVWAPDDPAIDNIQNELNDRVWDQYQAQKRGLKQEVEIGKEIERLECVEQEMLQRKLSELTDAMTAFEEEMRLLEHENGPMQASKKDTDEVSMEERMGVVKDRLYFIQRAQHNLNRIEERRERRLNRIARHKQDRAWTE